MSELTGFVGEAAELACIAGLPLHLASLLSILSSLEAALEVAGHHRRATFLWVSSDSELGLTLPI